MIDLAGAPQRYTHGWRLIGVPSGGTVTYHGNLGIDRGDMPQLSGTVNGQYVPSKALMPKFIAHLQAKGITVTSARVPARSLRPTQATGDTAAIRGIADSVKAGTDTKPVIISSDNRVLDGHHTWAGRVLADSEGGAKVPAGMPVVRAGLPITALLKEAGAFAAAQGIARRKAGVMANPAFTGKPALSGRHRDVINLAHAPYRYKHGWVKLDGAGPAADSLDAHTRGGQLTPERQALHEKIIAGALAGSARSADPTATFMGGGPASGKSATGKMRGVVINPDDVKAQLPEYAAMKAAGDKAAAAYVHEESSRVAKKIMDRAVAGKRDFTLDGTGDSHYEKLAGKVTAARKAGYHVHGQYVTVDTGEALKRAQARAAKTGRAVPETFLRETHAAVSGTFRQAIARDLFDSATLHDNNGPQGTPATLIGAKPRGGAWSVKDRAAYARFLAKENQ